MRTFGCSLAIAVFAATVSAATPVIRNPQPVPTGTTLVSDLALGDFNSDGWQDVLLLKNDGELAVELNNGTGPFAPPVTTPVHYATPAPAIGDFNRDGKLDVVVTDWPTRTGVLLTGDGAGAFAIASSFTTPELPGAIIAGDFNGDHLLDVAIATMRLHGEQNSLSVYPGDGAGHFASGISTPIDGPRRQLFAADMNNDGRTDVFDGRDVWLSNSNGTFTRSARLGEGTAAISDFNHDGRADLALVTDSMVDVCLGNGDGTFNRPVRYPGGYYADSIVAKDVDGDGAVDLLVASSSGSDIAVMRGRGDGRFADARHFLAGPGALAVVAADFDRDGKVDFVTLDNDPITHALSFVRGKGDGSFDTYRAYHTNSQLTFVWPGLNTRGGVPADVNRDGKLDVVFWQDHPGSIADMDLGILLNDEAGGLRPPILIDTHTGGYFVVGDVNADGIVDVVIVGNTSVALLGNGDATFRPVPFEIEKSGEPFIADFDGDGFADLLVNVGYEKWLYRDNGNGTFGAGALIPLEQTILIVADVNGDRRPDLVFPEGVSLNDGHGHFGDVRPVSTREEQLVAAADFNGDGKIDLAFVHFHAGIGVRLGNGDGTFAAETQTEIAPELPIGLSDSTAGVVTGDFDGDGKLDLAFGSTIVLGNGDGTFASRVVFRTLIPQDVHAADMDGNGTTDLVLVSGGDDVDVILTRKLPAAMAKTTITLASPGVAQFGSGVKFTAHVDAGRQPLRGVVRFAANGRSLALIAPDENGDATFITAFQRGDFDITATYTGDDRAADAEARTLLQVGRAVPRIAMSMSPNAPLFWQTILIRVGAGGLDPFAATGTFTVHDGTRILAIVNAPADIVYLTLSPGTHTITADYSGDQNFEAASITRTIVVGGTPKNHSARH